MDTEKARQQQPGAQSKIGPGTGVRQPTLLRELRQDAFSMLLDVLTGKQIQFHVQIIPKNAPESKEGEPARSVYGRLLLLMGWESGGVLVGCLFSGITYLPGARQEPDQNMHGCVYAGSIPPFLSG